MNNLSNDSRAHIFHCSLDGQYEGFYLVEKTVRAKLEDMLARELASSASPGTCESLVSGGLCMALTFIQRFEREHNQHKGSSDKVGLKLMTSEGVVYVIRC